MWLKSIADHVFFFCILLEKKIFFFLFPFWLFFLDFSFFISPLPFFPPFSLTLYLLIVFFFNFLFWRQNPGMAFSFNFTCLGILPCKCVCALHACSAHNSQKRSLRPPKRVQTVVTIRSDLKANKFFNISVFESFTYVFSVF